MKYSQSILVVLLFLFIMTPLALIHSQQILQSDINVDMIPENPGPNKLVSVTISSFNTDLNKATVTWRINGSVVKTGKGEKNFSFTTGSVNTTTTLNIVAQTTEGDTINKTFRIRPAQVDLIWQTQGFTPPFYKGKTLFSHQNTIIFIAIPHITVSGSAEISPKNLIYKWTKNGSVVEDASGYGKNTYTLVSSIVSRALDIEVEVTGAGTNSVGFARTIATPIEPSVIFYKKSPLYGIEFQKALTGNVELLDSKEITVVGFPLFFGTLNAFNSDLSYKWSINSSPIDSDYSQIVRVFRQNEGTSGTSNISLSIENSNKVLQFAKNSFNLKFGSQATTQSAF